MKLELYRGAFYDAVQYKMVHLLGILINFQESQNCSVAFISVVTVFDFIYRLQLMPHSEVDPGFKKTISV